VGPAAFSWIIFACVFGGALLGMFLRATLPEYHQSTESKDVLKLLIVGQRAVEQDYVGRHLGEFTATRGVQD
jgi:hypothetical protein